MLLSDQANGEFDNQVHSFLAKARDHVRTAGLFMKPLNRDTVETTPAGLNDGKEPKLFDEGTDLTVHLEIRFKSKFEYLKIVDSHIEPARVKLEFAPESLLQASQQETTITPDRLDALDPGGQTAQVYKVDVNMGKVKLRKDLKSIFKAAWGGNSIETVSLHIPLAIQVPQTNFHFKDDFVKQYHAPSLDAAKLSGKVYAIETLPEMLSERQTSIKMDLPVTFRVKYPMWAAVVSLLLICLAGALLGLLIWLIVMLARRAKPKKAWAVTATNEYGQALPCKIANGVLTVVEDPAGRIEGGRYVPPEGAAIVAGNDQVAPGATVGVRLRRRTVLLKFQEQQKTGGRPPEKVYTPRRI
jgi:hypothetical protein